MKAIILAGGKGERLRPFTDNCPKGMIQLEGKPILGYQIEWLKKFGINEIVFACGYMHEKIKEYFGDGKKYSISIQYSIEDKPLGRGGAIKKAWELIDTNETIIVLNGDIYTTLDLRKVIEMHEEQTTNHIIATICLFKYRSSYGIVKVNSEGLVEKFEEKPTLPYWINGGIYIFEPEVKKYLPDNGDHETTTFPELARKRLLYGYESMDYWRGIDTVKDLSEFLLDKKTVLSFSN